MSTLSRWLSAVTVVALAMLLVAPIGAQDDEDRGSLVVSAGIEAASIFVEGFSVGEAPVTLTGLKPGEYRVVVKGFVEGDFVADVAVDKGRTATVSAVPAVGQQRWSSPVRREDDWTPVTDDDQKRLEKANAARPLREYQRLEIANFLVKSEQPVPPEHLFSVFGNLLKGLEDRKKLRDLELATNYSLGPSERWLALEGPDTPTMILSGVITKYEPGSRAKRYFVGFGAGRTRVYALFRLVDKASGEILFERMESGSVAAGGFGGSSSGAMKELGQNIAKAIEREW